MPRLVRRAAVYRPRRRGAPRRGTSPVNLSAESARANTNLKETIMKRFHVHVAVEKLDDSIRFYSALFGAEPTVAKPDYAKWMLDDPRINFAISQRGHAAGLNHLGFQVDSDDALKGMRAQL